jgi:hypothetical protein
MLETRNSRTAERWIMPPTASDAHAENCWIGGSPLCGKPASSGRLAIAPYRSRPRSHEVAGIRDIHAFWPGMGFRIRGQTKPPARRLQSKQRIPPQEDAHGQMTVAIGLGRDRFGANVVCWPNGSTLVFHQIDSWVLSAHDSSKNPRQGWFNQLICEAIASAVMIPPAGEAQS